MRPETLEQCLAWLPSSAGLTSIVIGQAGLSIMSCNIVATVDIESGDIPAAIIAATQQVWDQVNGEASE